MELGDVFSVKLSGPSNHNRTPCPTLRRCRDTRTESEWHDDVATTPTTTTTTTTTTTALGNEAKDILARGPDTRMTAMPARPGTDESAKIVSSCATAPPDNAKREEREEEEKDREEKEDERGGGGNGNGGMRAAAGLGSAAAAAGGGGKAAFAMAMRHLLRRGRSAPHVPLTDALL